ncbi:MAG: SUMF1/EgtB/PvdO family nonheme iron enzyme [Candidatus Acidiferrales bacterium]
MTETPQAGSSPPADFTEPLMVKIPKGWFLMGSDAAQPGQDNERPVHRVWIDAFEMAACQVTVAEYTKFIAATNRRKPPHWNDPNFSHPGQPVVAPSWFDAVAYCEWLSSQTGKRYRLPTEAEWERAARGGAEQKLYPWGDEPLESLANYASRWKSAPERVGMAEKNTYGLFDIGANVHEWCSDWFDAGYYRSSPERNPQGPAEGNRKASRGGSWRHQTKVSRCAARSSIPPEFQYADYGFRVVRDAVRNVARGTAR